MTPGATLLLLLSPSAGAAAVAADLLEAIVASLSADPGLASAAPGGVWGDEAPIGAAMPFVVVVEPDGDSENESGDASLEPVRIQASVFAEDKAVARSVRKRVKGLLNDASLSFTAGTLLHLRADDRAGLKDPDRGPGGGDVWQEIQFFDALVGHGG